MPTAWCICLVMTQIQSPENMLDKLTFSLCLWKNSYSSDGFKKLVSTDHGGIKSDNPEWEFHHQYFVQGRGEWLENIKRKVC